MLNKIKITIQNVDVWKNNEVKYQISTKKQIKFSAGLKNTHRHAQSY